MLRLRFPEVTDEAKFREAWRICRDEGSGVDFAFAFDETTNFAEYVERLRAWPRGEGLLPSFVPSSHLIAVVGDEIVGRVSLRHELNEFLSRIGGHVGYIVLPRHRRKGYATEILRQTLLRMSDLGIDRALVTCDDENVASYRTIEKNAGVLENRIVDPATGKLKRRYWIQIAQRTNDAP